MTVPAVRLIPGDCTEIMPALFEEGLRADAMVCDPPYHLASIVDRLGSPDAAPIQSGATGVYAQSSSGFMGQQWDGGDVAFQAATWRHAFNLLRPGAHLVAFGGIRSTRWGPGAGWRSSVSLIRSRLTLATTASHSPS